ncbi:MAG TPA: ester cyclase [Methylomirabilota bacterium]|nr:ester cyclase [Methylomirabilota bacterium]
MPAEENKALVRRMLTAVRPGWTSAVLEEFFAPGYRRHLTPTGPHLTAGEQRERASRLRAAFPDSEATLEDILAEGDRVAYRLTIRGTHRGSFLGVEPTGRRVAVAFYAIVRVEGGKLAEEWGGLDQVDLLRQLREPGAPGPT